jgi:hypothetical protein
MCTKFSSFVQRGISLIELIMFIVLISVAETGMRINPEPKNLSGMSQ